MIDLDSELPITVITSPHSQNILNIILSPQTLSFNLFLENSLDHQVATLRQYFSFYQVSKWIFCSDLSQRGLPVKLTKLQNSA